MESWGEDRFMERSRGHPERELDGAYEGYIASGDAFYEEYWITSTCFYFYNWFGIQCCMCGCFGASMEYVQEHPDLRDSIMERAETLKSKFKDAGFPLMDTPTHIVPLIIGDAKKCKNISDDLLYKHGIYVQPINYPTVAVGTEHYVYSNT